MFRTSLGPPNSFANIPTTPKNRMHQSHSLRNTRRNRWPATLCLLIAFLLAENCVVTAATPAIEGYSDFAELSKQVQALAKPGLCSVASLVKSAGGRDIWLITIGRGETDRKPAVLIVSNVEAPHLIGSELAVRMARSLVQKADDESTKALLDRYTFYFVPRPNPDGSEAFFRSPLQERAGNDTRTDDDRDSDIDEDPANDLNGDGFITMMRVDDPAGKLMPHPGDARVMIEADPKKNEVGRYSLHVEGKDDDHDDQFNEDGAGGVSFNRNWTFKYPYFKAGAGPNQVSEPETRAVADFAFDHANIAAVFCFSPEDNLMHPWKPADNQGRIKTAIQKDDAAHVDYIAEKYREIQSGKDAPSSPPGQGSFSEWAYFHYGRWSLAARGWWIPQVKAEKKADEKPADDTKNNAGKTDSRTSADAKKSDEQKTDSRSADLVNALRWFEREKIEGFVPWVAVEQSDFPGKKVEVGGFKPFLLLNPPAKELDSLAEKHLEFVREFSELLPQLALSEVKVESLGAGVYRVSCTALNNGYLPTMCEMGRINGAAYPLQIELRLPDGTRFLKGHPRAEINRLAGRGGKSEVMWLVRTSDAKPADGKITVHAPAVGRAEATVELK
jgi:Zinc carboxypeptidase